MAKKIVMDKDYDKELADAVKRGKQIDKELKKKPTTKKTVKRTKKK